MKWILCLLFFSGIASAKVNTETFVIQIQDRSLAVTAPEKRQAIFAVLVENRSLSDQVARFVIGGKILKYITVKSGQSEAVEIENKTSTSVLFVPVSPAFQEAELTFGKKAYEIPAKE